MEPDYCRLLQWLIVCFHLPVRFWSTVWIFIALEYGVNQFLVLIDIDYAFGIQVSGYIDFLFYYVFADHHVS